MPLETLLVLVPVSLAVVMLVTHLLGGTTIPPLDVERARQAFLAEHPALAIERVRLDVAEQTAVVFLADGQIGVVVRLGDHLAVKLVPPERVTMHDERRLTVRFDDVGWPTRTLDLLQPTEREPERRSPHVRE